MSDKELDEEVQRIQGAYEDLMRFEPENLYSSLGKMTLSTLKTQPKYSLGTASRNKAQKVFQNKELCKTQYVGKGIAAIGLTYYRQDVQGAHL